MIDVYCDGATIKRNPSPHGGCWAWCHVVKGERIRQGSGTIPAGWLGMGRISNNLTELLAAVESVESLPINETCILYSDSRITLHRLNHGYRFNGIPDELRWRAEAARDRIERVKLLAGHPTKAQLLNGRGRKGRPVSQWNVWCDEECKRLAHEYLWRQW